MFDKCPDGLRVRRQVRFSPPLAERLKDCPVGLLRSERICGIRPRRHGLPFQKRSQRAFEQRLRHRWLRLEFSRLVDQFHEIDLSTSVRTDAITVIIIGLIEHMSIDRC